MSSARLPHFIVVGAMKCGTTTLRHLLRQHPQIFMPPREIFFFAVDDFEQHPGAMSGDDGRWRLHDFDGERERYLEWYAQFFAGASPSQVIGEGSTSYMPSEKAARRIAEIVPSAKLIFMLRDPVERAYSQYWHIVRSGAAEGTFEEMLKRTPTSLLQRSCYARQIQRYLERFPPGQLKFVIFEEFVRNAHRTATEVAAFVGVEEALPQLPAQGAKNAARVPRSLPLQLLRNRWLGPRGARERFADIGHVIGNAAPVRSGLRQTAERVFARVNPMKPGRPPAMNPDTRSFLVQLMKRENRGLSELIGIDVERFWYREADRPR